MEVGGECYNREVGEKWVAKGRRGEYYGVRIGYEQMEEIDRKGKDWGWKGEWEIRGVGNGKVGGEQES